MLENLLYIMFVLPLQSGLLALVTYGICYVVMFILFIPSYISQVTTFKDMGFLIHNVSLSWAITTFALCIICCIGYNFITFLN